MTIGGACLTPSSGTTHVLHTHAHTLNSPKRVHKRLSGSKILVHALSPLRRPSRQTTQPDGRTATRHKTPFHKCMPPPGGARHAQAMPACTRPRAYRKLLALPVQIPRVAPGRLLVGPRRQRGERKQPRVDVLDEQRVVPKGVGGRLHPVPTVRVCCRHHLGPGGYGGRHGRGKGARVGTGLLFWFGCFSLLARPPTMQRTTGHPFFFFRGGAIQVVVCTPAPNDAASVL